VGGYGTIYLQELLQNAAERGVKLVAGIDPYPERAAMSDELKQAHIPLFADLETFFRNESADLVILASPIHLHAPQTCLALAHGAHVLCEKPLAGSLADARLMMEAEQKSGKRVAIGYQWSFSDAVLALKRDILAGRLGRPRQLNTVLLWSRSQAYYQRNDWAGRVRSTDGAWVLDSPVNNATAHYLHNMLFLLGGALDESACPVRLQAELYRANAIENYDTAALRLVMDGGAELLFLTTHAVLEVRGPLIQYEFDEAVVEYAPEIPQFRVRFRNGTAKSYGSPGVTEYNKLWQMVQVARAGGPVVCGLRTALPHLLCVTAAQEAPVVDFPRGTLRMEEEGEGRTVWVDGLAEVFMECYQSNRLPSESRAAPWAVKATQVDHIDQNYASVVDPD
jgi:predicted dehydrogenase